MSATTMPKARRAAPRQVASSRAPRRVSGPEAGRAGARPVQHHTPTVGARALAVVRSLPDHSLIDRLVRGRAWIPVLGVLLAGIVATQVEILKLGTSLGRSLERTTALQSQNESLQAQVATLGNDQRIEALAAGMGMVIPSPSLLTFVPAHPRGQLGQAIANIHSPDPVDFAAQLSAQVASDAVTAPATSAASTGAGQTTAASTGGVGSTALTVSGATASAGDGGGAAAAAPTTLTTPSVPVTSTAPASAGSTSPVTGTASGSGSGSGTGSAAPTGAAGLPSSSASGPASSTGG